MAKSIFSKIIDREISAQIIYEDDKTVAFLDAFPTQPGHTLVVPKVEVEQLWDLDDEYYEAVWRTAKIVANKLKALGRERVGIKLVGVHVPHVHLHLIPFDDSKELYSNPDPEKASDEDLARIAKKLNKN
jgi:histidine triad (HIT) family protein